MSTEADTLASSLSTTAAVPTSAEENRTASALPVFLSASSSTSKPLRDRNRTNLKRRTNLSRSQVLSNDFENEDILPPAKAISKPANTDVQPPSTPIIHLHTTELYSQSISPTTPSPIHTTVTCNQVWERLASNEEYQNPSPVKPTTNNLPTHISFTFSQSDNDDQGDTEDLPSDDINDFQFIPVTSQSSLARFQFINFAQQQQLNDNSDEERETKAIMTQPPMDDSEEDDEQEEEEEQENQLSKKRKRSVSATDSLEAVPAATTEDHEATSTNIKAPCTKKPRTKDPNANFLRLNMRKKHFSHAKKHQFSKHKRNAFYRRTRNAGGGAK